MAALWYDPWATTATGTNNLSQTFTTTSTAATNTVYWFNQTAASNTTATAYPWWTDLNQAYTNQQAIHDAQMHNYQAQMRDYPNSVLSESAQRAAAAVYQAQQAERRLFVREETERYRERMRAQRDIPAPAINLLSAREQRARELLEAHLTPEQLDTFKKLGWFVVEGGRTKNKYRIGANGSLVANVAQLHVKGFEHSRLCAHLNHRVDCPHSDHILAQKLMLEGCEDEFLRIANRSAGLR